MMQNSQDDISHLIDPLNHAQRQAVCASASNLLVLAGAGSGKTRVLIHRIAWLMQVERVSPHGILAVTFTNKAANEMRNRLQNLVGFSVSRMWVGTFHGLAHRLLRIHWADADLQEGFQILDSDDQYRLIRNVMKALNLDEKQWPPKQAQWQINQYKEEGLRVADIAADNDRYVQVMSDVYLNYQARCEKSGLVDFAELLLRVDELFRNKPQVLSHYRQRFQHILVDEFQDTNTIQFEWLQKLGVSAYGFAGGDDDQSFRVRDEKMSPTLPCCFAVGDDDQSIYAWRGAKVTHLQRFQTEFKDSQLLRLEQNYRSTATILEAANALIENNTGRLGKKLWTDGQEGAPIGLYTAFNEYDEARFVVERIKGWVADGGHYTDCAVLYRSNAQSRVLEQELLQARLPYRVYGGLRFFERQEIKDALGYLRLLANSNDDSAFERVINTPTRGIGDRSIETVRQEARRSGLSLWQATSRVLVAGELGSRATHALRRFQELIVLMRQETAQCPLHELTEQVLQRSGLLDFYKNKKGEREQMRVENLAELISATQQYHDDSLMLDGMTPLQTFLGNVALDAGDEKPEGSANGAQLMTLHSAKGLEFRLVFLCGLEEKLFPHQMSLQDANGLEEERRLCYVGITRAMQQLYLSYAEVRRLHGTENYTRPSRFIQEIPLALIEPIRLRSVSVSQPIFTPAPAAHLEISHSQVGGGFVLGQRVIHAKFGEGVILAQEGSGAAQRVQVDFRQQGTKWLVLAYANLQSCVGSA